jgi:Ferredoxin subunits of nitrite reductase and ring-hydroxylating dioxygenases
MDHLAPRGGCCLSFLELVFREGDSLYAIEDKCTHDSAELCGGLYMSGEIECPTGGARFCIKTAQALSAPAYGAVSTFPFPHQG